MLNFGKYFFVLSLTISVASPAAPAAVAPDSAAASAAAAPAPASKPAINCDVMRRCAVTINEPVNAATVGKKDCLVFRNECYFKEAYCQRQRARKALIRKITRKECLASTTCNSACSKVYQPVCAEFLDKTKIFGNDCQLSVQSCKNNKGWVYLKDGECKN